MTKTVIMEYEFTSTRADGDAYTRRVPIKASNQLAALNVAKIVGWQEFGARFTENCIDWRVVRS